MQGCHRAGIAVSAGMKNKKELQSRELNPGLLRDRQEY